MKTEYKEGVKVRKEFERTMTELFRAPKPTGRKQPKVASLRKPKRSDKAMARNLGHSKSKTVGIIQRVVFRGAIVESEPDESGKPSFNILQNYGSSEAPVFYYVFDVLVLNGRDVMGEPLIARRKLIEKYILPKLGDRIRYSPELPASLADLIHSVKAQGLEGLVAKRRDSRYEPGQRSGAWQKMRVNQGQEFVIAGYTPSDKNFDALVMGYYEGGKLLYAGRTRNGFTPASRAELFKKLRPLQIDVCPFANLPEKKSGRWGAGLTAAKMKECKWLKPALIGQFEFVEWTSDLHLRHTRFIALREDKRPQDVRRE